MSVALQVRGHFWKLKSGFILFLAYKWPIQKHVLFFPPKIAIATDSYWKSDIIAPVPLKWTCVSVVTHPLNKKILIILSTKRSAFLATEVDLFPFLLCCYVAIACGSDWSDWRQHESITENLKKYIPELTFREWTWLGVSIVTERVQTEGKGKQDQTNKVSNMILFWKYISWTPLHCVSFSKLTHIELLDRGNPATTASVVRNVCKFKTTQYCS